MNTRKKFFTALATVLLFPGGLILVVAVSILLAFAIALLIYCGAIYQASKWCWNKLGSLLNFGKAKSENGPDRSRTWLEVPEAHIPKDVAQGISEKTTVFDGRPSARGRWLQ